MSTDLVHIGNEQIQVGGQGLDFGSKLFALKPSTLVINQNMTQAENAIPGKLRITETGEQFDSMTVVMLTTPIQQRDYHVGGPSTPKSLDTLMCFSRDMVKPNIRAKDPQAMVCNGCPKSSWNSWNENKIPQNIPPCDAYYKAAFIDTQYHIPLNMYIRGVSKAPFEAAMQNFVRFFTKLKASTGKQPNIYDISFTLSAKKDPKRKTTYVLDVAGTSFKEVTPEDREAFGEIFVKFANRNAQPEQQAKASAKVDEVINAEGEIEI